MVVIRAGSGYSISSAMSLFDIAHTTSYSSFRETMHLACTVFEIQDNPPNSVVRTT